MNSEKKGQNDFPGGLLQIECLAPSFKILAANGFIPEKAIAGVCVCRQNWFQEDAEVCS